MNKEDIERRRKFLTEKWLMGYPMTEEELKDLDLLFSDDDDPFGDDDYDDDIFGDV